MFLGEHYERNESRTWFVIPLTASMMVVETVAGTRFGSTALVADGLAHVHARGRHADRGACLATTMTMKITCTIMPARSPPAITICAPPIFTYSPTPHVGPWYRSADPGSGSDPAMGVVGAVVIAGWSWTLVRDAGAVLLYVPKGEDLPDDIRTAIEESGTASPTSLAARAGHHGAIISISHRSRRSPLKAMFGGISRGSGRNRKGVRNPGFQHLAAPLARQKNMHYFLTMRTIVASTPDRIVKRARSSGRGSVFTPSDFLDLGERAAIDQALSRLAKTGKFRRLARGLYDFPRVHPKLGVLSPAPDDIARALARETGSQVQVAGPRAANVLGLSTQVPARSSYLTDGPSRRVVLGKRIVDLRHASPKHLIAPGSAAGTVVQALRHLGRSRAADVVHVASRQLSQADKKRLAATAVQAPAWMRATLHAIADTTSGAVNG